MKRRTFLTAAAGVAASPLLVRRAFAQAPSARAEALFDAYRRARQHRRPLMVILVPDAQDQFWHVGAAWGEYINHGSERQLAPLAIFEPACGTAADLAKLAPQAVLPKDARFVVIGTDAMPASTKAYAAALPERGSGRGLVAAAQAKVEAAIDARISALAALVTEAAEDRAGTFVAPEEGWGEPEHLDVEAAPGWCWRRARAHDPAGRLTERLADVARARFRDEPIPGSRWARSGGCGVRVEGATDHVAIGCGMGHTPRRSQRMLYFFEKGSRG